MNLLFGFSGRIGRAKWWLAEFVVFLVWIAAALVFAGVVKMFDPSAEHEPGALSNGGLSLGVVILCALILGTWINVAATVKRFHDRDKSGFWYFIIFVPFIGPVWQLVECGMLPGVRGGNRFGPSPGGYDGISDSTEDYVAQLREAHAAQSGHRVAAPAARVAPALASPSRTPARPGGFGRRGR